MKISPFKIHDESLFRAEWEQLQTGWSRRGSDWADNLLTDAKTPDGGHDLGCGNWGSLALDLDSGRAEFELFGSSSHQHAHIDLALEIETELGRSCGRPDREAHRRVADFRIAAVDGYEVPWAICADTSRGIKHSRADLRDWFLAQRLALPLFWLQFQSMPDELRVGFGLK